MPGVCPRCCRNVYFAEQKVALGRVWHVFCFSCASCRKLLDSCTFAPHNGELYCMRCHSRLFGSKPCAPCESSSCTPCLPVSVSCPAEVDCNSCSPCGPKKCQCCDNAEEEQYWNSQDEDSSMCETRSCGSGGQCQYLKPCRCCPRSKSPSLKPCSVKFNCPNNSPTRIQACYSHEGICVPRKSMCNAMVQTKPFMSHETSAYYNRQHNNNSKKQNCCNCGYPVLMVPQCRNNQCNNDICDACPCTHNGGRARSRPRIRSCSPLCSSGRKSCSPTPVSCPSRNQSCSSQHSPSSSGPSSRASSPLRQRCRNTSPCTCRTPNACLSTKPKIRKPLGGGAICRRCNQTVYPAEQMLAAGGFYHTCCFSCYCCHLPLDTRTLREGCKEIYCRPCYIKKFGPCGYGYGIGATLNSP